MALLVAEVSPTGTDRYGICEKLYFLNYQILGTNRSRD